MSGPGDLDAEIWRNRDRRIRELTPAQVPDRGPGERPQFYIIGGQQAAGKTTTQKRLHRMLDPASVAFYDGDDNEKIHPHYKEIMRAHGRGGTMEMINRLGREHNYHAEYLSHLTGAYGGPKYDVIASQPLGREEGADWWLNGFQNQGYETTAVFVATHESNSRLGIAHRYQQDRDDPKKLYGRWVPLEFHDGAYQNNPNVAHHLESQSKVDHLFVVNRDGQVLHENHRGPDGTMVNELGARDAIIAERNRAPTPEEEVRFDATVAYMRNTDPNFRPESVDPEVAAAVDQAVEQREQLRSSVAGAAPSAAAPRVAVDEAIINQRQSTNAAQAGEGAAGRSASAAAPPFLAGQRRSTSGNARVNASSGNKGSSFAARPRTHGDSDSSSKSAGPRKPR